MISIAKRKLWIPLILFHYPYNAPQPNKIFKNILYILKLQNRKIMSIFHETNSTMVEGFNTNHQPFAYC